MTMRFCPNCGSGVSGGDMFCANCGTPVEAPMARTPHEADQPAALPDARRQPPAAASAPTDRIQTPQVPSGARHRHVLIAVIAVVAVIALIVCGVLVVGHHARRLSADCRGAVSELTSADTDVSDAERQARRASKLKAGDLADSTTLDDLHTVLKSAPGDAAMPSCAMSLAFGRLKDDAAKARDQAGHRRAYARKLADAARKVLDSQDAAKLADARSKLKSARDEAQRLLSSAKNVAGDGAEASLRKAIDAADDMLSSDGGISIRDMSGALDALDDAMDAVDDVLPPSVGGLRTYRNARFGYSVAVPDSYTWGRESDDGDGRSFTDASGRITITVFGENNTSGATPESLQSDMAAGHGDITYQTHGANFAVVSYYEDGQGVYVKKFVNAGTIATLRLQWPAELTDSVGGPLTEQVEDSFRPGNDTAS